MYEWYQDWIVRTIIDEMQNRMNVSQYKDYHMYISCIDMNLTLDFLLVSVQL